MSILLVLSALLLVGQTSKAAAPGATSRLRFINEVADQGGADDVKGRQESVKDLRAALSDKKKHCPP